MEVEQRLVKVVVEIKIASIWFGVIHNERIRSVGLYFKWIDHLKIGLVCTGATAVLWYSR